MCSSSSSSYVRTLHCPHSGTHREGEKSRAKNSWQDSLSLYENTMGLSLRVAAGGEREEEEEEGIEKAFASSHSRYTQVKKRGGYCRALMLLLLIR